MRDKEKPGLLQSTGENREKRNVSDPIGAVHQIPRGLAVDEVIELGANMNRQIGVVEDEK